MVVELDLIRKTFPMSLIGMALYLNGRPNSGFKLATQRTELVKSELSPQVLHLIQRILFLISLKIGKTERATTNN